ncbi:MAG: hypothetical protein AAGI23_03960 [Bacteroidota bacterium]
MKSPYILLILLPFLCCQCATSKYDIFKVESVDAQRDNDGRFVSERPYLKVEYDYWSYGGVVWMRATNTSDADLWLYIDNSGLEVNNKSLPHMSAEEIFLALRDRNFYPQPKVKLSPKQTYVIESYPIQAKRWNYKGEEPPLYYESTNSPLRIKSKWTIARGGDQNTMLSIYDEFYVSSIERIPRQTFKQQEDWLASDMHFYFFKDYRQLWAEVALELVGIGLALLVF